MITLRKIAKSDKYIFNADLIGVRNGSNQVFSLNKPYKSGTLFVTYNGQALYPDYDFNELDNTSIEFIYIFPKSKDVLKAHYEQS